MNTIILIFATMFLFHNIQAQENDKFDLYDLAFLVGKWEAIANDSSFISVLEYKFSPEGRLLFASNHLYGKEGKNLGVYEGAYLLDDQQIIYFLSGPKGETHEGTATIVNDTLVHLASVNPGRYVKTYRSEMVFKDGRLYYYANYTKEKEYPSNVEYNNPLIYVRQTD